MFVVALSLPAMADGDLRVTLLDGDARVLDSRGTLAAAAGLGIPGPALVQTTAATRLLRLEWASGTAVDLGPDTQLLIAPLGLGDKPGRGVLYLQRGWVKLSAASGEPPPQLLSVYAATTLQQGALVGFVGQGQAWLFDESGAAQVADRPPRGPALALGSGQSYVRAGSESGRLVGRAAPELVRDVPRSFRDTLPRRHAQAAARPAAPRPLTQPAFNELREWLATEATVRRYIATHFAHWAGDGGFRAALLAQEKDHPDWAQVLHPERARRP